LKLLLFDIIAINLSRKYLYEYLIVMFQVYVCSLFAQTQYFNMILDTQELRSNRCEYSHLFLTRCRIFKVSNDVHHLSLPYAFLFSFCPYKLFLPFIFILF